MLRLAIATLLSGSLLDRFSKTAAGSDVDISCQPNWGRGKQNVIYCFQLYNSPEKKMSRKVGNAGYKTTSSRGGVGYPSLPPQSISVPTFGGLPLRLCLHCFLCILLSALSISATPRNWKPWDSSWLCSSSLSRIHKVEFLESESRVVWTELTVPGFFLPMKNVKDVHFHPQKQDTVSAI